MSVSSISHHQIWLLIFWQNLCLDIPSTNSRTFCLAN